MREIGGYIELDKYSYHMLHEEAILLNYARNALKYVLEARKIELLYIPKFLCDSVWKACNDIGVRVSTYSIDVNFMPLVQTIEPNAWVYVVNYYGQFTNEIISFLSEKYDKKIIVDNVQSYFQMPIPGIDTIYTCRKYFGVADGAILYTNTRLNRELKEDFSFDRMVHVLGRVDKNASEFYQNYVHEESNVCGEVRMMSKLTKNLLHGINYEVVKEIRMENFCYLHNYLDEINKLRLVVQNGTFMYPLMLEKGNAVRRELIKRKIYIPVLWPNVCETCGIDETERMFAENILPLPIDQRYNIKDMKYILSNLYECIEGVKQ